MNEMTKWLSVLLTAIILLTTVALAEETGPKIGSLSPTLSIKNLDGQNVSLQDYAGKKPVILTFMASWSKSCQAALKELQILYLGNRDKVEVLAVSFDKKSAELKSYVAENDIPFPVLYDRKLTSLDRFQVLIIPTTFCINRDGVIDKVFIDYDDNVKKALAEWVKS